MYETDDKRYFVLFTQFHYMYLKLEEGEGRGKRLRHCTTSRKDAGSIPHGVFETD